MSDDYRATATRRHVLATLLAGAGLALGLTPIANAATYPEKPISVLVSYPPGGGSDLIIRMLAPYIERELGNGARIIIMNKPGAGGEIGFAELARSAPDGYTIGLINTPNVLTIPIERKPQFNWQSYSVIGNIVDDPGNFAVHTDSPFKNLRELATYAKAHPGEVSVGTTGAGSDDHLAMLIFEKAAGVKMLHVPFKGAAEVRTALQGKQIVVAAMNIGEALQYAKSGVPLRNLGVMSPARSPLAPDVPTFREQGYDINLASLRGLAAPKGLPPEIRDRLVGAVQRGIADPKFQTQAAGIFAPLRYLAPTKYAEELRDGEAQFRQLWKEMPWTDK
jgi:tripartite-type tricarboxylate transporter receptor subunit TctC